MAKNVAADAVLVIGLGRFGGALALMLERLGHAVLAVDASHAVVQEYSGQITHAAEADATSAAALRQLGAQEFRTAIVAISTGIEASLLSAGALVDFGVPQVWAKAITTPHGRILERIGVQHVVYPEIAMGERVAHLITGKILDFIEFEDGYAIAKLQAPKQVTGRTLADSGLRTKYGVTIVGVKSHGQDFTHAQPQTFVAERDLLIVSGRTDLVEEFAASM